jgi:hypothetical protein
MSPYARNAQRAVKIDIDGLSEDELIELNHKVVARLRFLREMRSFFFFATAIARSINGCATFNSVACGFK